MLVNYKYLQDLLGIASSIFSIPFAIVIWEINYLKNSH